MSRKRALSPTDVETHHVRKDSSSSPEPVKASPAVKEQRPTCESGKTKQSDETSVMATELRKTHRTSRSESDEKKRNELSASEEVGVTVLFLVTLTGE